MCIRDSGRGINLGNMLEAPVEGKFGHVLKKEYLSIVKKRGFKSVRIPINWAAHALDTAPYTIDEAFFKRIDEVIAQALEQKLYVIINIHHFDGMTKDPDRHILKLLSLWKQIAEHYKSLPESVVFQLLNEPHSQLTPKKWNSVLAQVIPVIRASNPDRTLIVSSAEYSNYYAVDYLRLPENDKNIIVSIHYYLPNLFTFQGATFMPGEYHTAGVVWPGPPQKEVQPAPGAVQAEWSRNWFQRYNTVKGAENPASEENLDRHFAKLEKWSKDNKRPINVGEFGTYYPTDMASRRRWTEAVVKAAVSRGFSFHYWEFCSGFGVYNAKANKWTGLEEALFV
eukprot:TRINITY_DN7826_c0_g5_i1.p1 TRINITY_DN7826_c0_g5~~TRINITY_DN7826_c0_g5_i1.p1  ORF type:complete len:339 (-),score=84.51 TRINITY_DN7826_c0_g5_i1:67-1083(-)